MKNFTMAKEQFRKMRCGHCQESFQPEGVKLLREEKDYWVVRVTCLNCGQPAGVAIIGVDYESPEGFAQTEAPKAPKRDRVEKLIFNSRQEEERFAKREAITSDELIEAHRFFQGLGDDWMRHLPR